MQGFSTMARIIVAPLFFGLAHVHHFREYIVHKGLPVQDAIQMVRPRLPVGLLV